MQFVLIMLSGRPRSTSISNIVVEQGFMPRRVAVDFQFDWTPNV